MATRKRATAPTADTVSIHDACLRYMTEWHEEKL